MFENITYREKLNISYERALEKMTRILVKEGFRVMTNLELRNTASLILDAGSGRFSILSLGDPIISLESTLFEQIVMPVYITIEETAQGSIISIGQLEAGLLQDFFTSSREFNDIPSATLKRLEFMADSLSLSSDLELIKTDI
ncbi:MAG: hypothetical protein DRI97_17625 [Bacteroidetes bacterium]|nr:MAG: hypothetical protein DRI97_17625 [Bacteroidota bacterium]